MITRLTEQESTEVRELWAQYELLKDERESIQWEMSKMGAQLYELRCQMEDITRRVEDIQGENDWG
jgi:uncharacterized coiled-coil DUF342 family protein